MAEIDQLLAALDDDFDDEVLAASGIHALEYDDAVTQTFVLDGAREV
jgi:hypothetical protein